MRMLAAVRRQSQGRQVCILATLSVLLIVAPFAAAALLSWSGTPGAVAFGMWVAAAVVWVAAIMRAMPQGNRRHNLVAWAGVAAYAVAFALPAAHSASGWMSPFDDRAVPGWYAFALGWIAYPAATAMNLVYLFALDRYRRARLGTSGAAVLVAVALGLQPVIGITWGGSIGEDLPLAAGYWAWLAGPALLWLAVLQEMRSSKRPSAAVAVS